MGERKGQRILLMGVLIFATQLSGEHDRPSSSIDAVTGTNQPGFPTETGEYKTPLDLTIANLVKELSDHSFNLVIEITTPINGETHTFFCRPGYHSCLWYPPKNGNYPGATDVHLNNLDIMLTTGSTFTIKRPPDTGLRVKQKVLVDALSRFNDAEFTLQNPEVALDGDYLTEGANFLIENNGISTPQSLA